MSDLKPVTVKKGKLLLTLAANREKHITIYYEAQRGYEEKAKQLLSDRLDEFNMSISSRSPMFSADLSFSLPKPVSHMDSYNKAIGMLEWSVNDTVELDAGQFDNFVNDNWSWQFGFLSGASDIAMSGSLAVTEFGAKYSS